MFELEYKGYVEMIRKTTIKSQFYQVLDSDLFVNLNASVFPSTRDFADVCVEVLVWW